jgi:hypothetical protein
MMHKNWKPIRRSKDQAGVVGFYEGSLDSSYFQEEDNKGYV